MGRRPRVEYGKADEYKQRITLSPLVQAVIQEDSMNMEGNDNRNGFILHVIERMMNDENIDLASTEKKECEHYAGALRKIAAINNQIHIENYDELAAALAKDRVGRIHETYELERERRNKEVKEGSKDITLRLTDAINEKLERKSANWPAPIQRNPYEKKRYGYYRRRKDYIEHILWRYSELPANERERVYCRDLIQEIENVCKEPAEKRHGVIVSMRNDGGGKGSVYRVAPCCLMMDSGGNYRYLAGISERIGARSEGRQYASIRISRIKSIEKDRHVVVSEQEFAELRDRIRRRGVAYILGPVNTEHAETQQDEKIVVRLSHDGWRKYHSILRNRPQYSNVSKPEPDESGEVTLEFDCSELQIENYFYMYGADAYIVSPMVLRQKFAEHYQRALELYSRSNGLKGKGK